MINTRATLVKNGALDLSHIFEPIRADLALVDAEFGRHVQSQVELILRVGTHYGLLLVGALAQR